VKTTVFWAWRRLVWWRLTDVSGVLSASIIRELRKPALYTDCESRSVKMASFGTLRHVVWYKFTDVSGVVAASIVRVPPDDGGSKHL
jgi:hypothetical protein